MQPRVIDVWSIAKLFKSAAFIALNLLKKFMKSTWKITNESNRTESLVVAAYIASVNSYGLQEAC
jgi:allophanate hydrolase subunit 2